MEKKRKALVAMSGGVDSSVAAALMVERGWDSIGVTLKLLARAETGFGCCGSPADVDDARRVCDKLEIPHYVLELSQIFEDKVIRPFVDSYLSGRTPNPCVECNRSLKFGYLLGLAEAWGCEKVATGHYAQVENGRLLASVDDKKDQTYFLYSLTGRELPKVEFPVGGLRKDEVRAVARKLGLRTADKPESQEICFVPARDYRAFVAARPEAAGAPALEPGRVVDEAGRELSRHEGVAGFTVGQRKGLGISGGDPRFVVRLEPESNTVVVGSRADASRLELLVERVTWTSAPPQGPVSVKVRIRHRHSPAAARLEPLGVDRARVIFQEPQPGAAPGQAAVFYDANEVLGGGTIAFEAGGVSR